MRNPPPSGWPQATSSLFYREPAKAIDWLCEAFGFEVRARYGEGDVIHHAEDDWYLARQIVFDRTNLTVHQQIIYDRNGAIATEATYQVYQDYNGVSFPSVIEIKRPHALA